MYCDSYFIIGPQNSCTKEWTQVRVRSFLRAMQLMSFSESITWPEFETKTEITLRLKFLSKSPNQKELFGCSSSCRSTILQWSRYSKSSTQRCPTSSLMTTTKSCTRRLTTGTKTVLFARLWRRSTKNSSQTLQSWEKALKSRTKWRRSLELR